MEFFQKLSEWLGFDSNASREPTPIDEIRETMEIARLAKRNEDYDRAFSHLEQAMQIADKQNDTDSITIIALHQADVLITSEQYDRASELLNTILNASERVSQPGFLSYALSSQGTLHQKRGEWALARESYERARDLARANNATGAEGRALGHMADVYLHETNASYAVHLLEESLPKINAAGDLELSSYFVGRLGEAMNQNGQETQGRQLLDRALRLAEQMQDKAMIRRWSQVIGDRLIDIGNYGEAHLFYNRALQLYPEKPQIDHVDLYAKMSQISLGLRENDEAIHYARKAIEYAEDLNSTEYQAKAQSILGIALRVADQHEEAITVLQSAIENNTGNDKNLDLTRNLAAAQMESGKFDDALQTYQTAMEKARNTKNEITVAEVQRDMGILFVNQRKLNKAIQYWNDALVAFDRNNDHNQTARLYCDIANARRQLGMSSRAIRDFEQALMALNSVTDIATRGLVLSNAANAYVDQGDIDSAASFFKESIDIAQQINDPTAQSTRLGNYGWFLLTTGKPP